MFKSRCGQKVRFFFKINFIFQACRFSLQRTWNLYQDYMHYCGSGSVINWPPGSGSTKSELRIRILDSCTRYLFKIWRGLRKVENFFIFEDLLGTYLLNDIGIFFFGYKKMSRMDPDPARSVTNFGLLDRDPYVSITAPRIRIRKKRVRIYNSRCHGQNFGIGSKEKPGAW